MAQMSSSNFSTEKLPKFYDIGGDIRELEFSVSLYSVAQSGVAGLMFPGFGGIIDKFSSVAINEETGIGEDGGPHPSLSSSSFGRFLPLDGGDEKGMMEEKRTIRWMESVPRPAIGPVIIEEEEEEAEEDEVDDDDPDEEEGREEVEEEEVPEDPRQAEEVRKGGKKKKKKVIRQRRHQSALSHRIFTLLDTEMAPPIGGEETKMGHHINVPPAGGSLRQRKIVPMDNSAPKEPVQIMTSEQRRRNRVMEWSEQRWRIMAYLGDEHAYDPSEEYILWELRLTNGRRMSAEPDIDEVRTVHSAKTGNTFRASLTVKDHPPLVFDELTAEEEQEEDEHQWDGDGGGRDFEVPESNDEYWLHYMVEIGKAVGFPHDNLSVEWMLELPENCELLRKNEENVQQQTLRGLTERSAVKGVQREDVAHFGHLIEFGINCQLRPVEDGQEFSSGILWPRLLFRVTGEDGYWSRFYVDGYTILSLPFNPGPTHDISLQCWRPAIPNSKMCALREAHLGQAVDLAGGIGLAGSKDAGGNWASIYSRAGLSTESSGTLMLSVHCVHQCRHFISRDQQRSLRYSTMLRRIGISGDLQARIGKVLEEFERVRRQLIRIKGKRRRKARAKSGAKSK